MQPARFKSSTVFVNGVNLHYLDWGGVGPALIFLPGWGCNAYIFTHFAPRFSNRFRVLALTRRGHGDSDHPENGYDLDSLTEDIRQFMDALGIERVVLAGHSLAGVELSHMAVKYPQRIDKLVYLDSAFEYGRQDFKDLMAKNPARGFDQPDVANEYDTAEEYEAAILRAFPSLAAIWGPVMRENFLHEIKTNPEGKVVDRMSEGIGDAIQQTMNSFRMDDARIQAPALSIFVLQDANYYISKEWMTPEQQSQMLAWFEQDRLPWLRSWIEEYQYRQPQAQVAVIPKGHHYCFLPQEEQVYREMRKFLES